MVKNIGGNRAKKMGRKFIKGSDAEDRGVGLKTRLSKDPNEIYAAIIKEYGNGRCAVKCIDGVERTMVIRKKFKGRGKRGSYVKSGTWVLIGLREFEARRADSAEICDLLEVYSDYDIRYLKKNIQVSWSIIAGIGKVADDDMDYDNISDDEEDYGINRYALSDDEEKAKKKVVGKGQYVDLEISDDSDSDLESDGELNIDDL